VVSSFSTVFICLLCTVYCSSKLSFDSGVVDGGSKDDVVVRCRQRSM
jgi:hypothetical protein